MAASARSMMIPHPQQVGDRWHLLGILRETVERLLLRHNAKPREADPLVASPPAQTQVADADPVLPR